MPTTTIINRFLVFTPGRMPKSGSAAAVVEQKRGSPGLFFHRDVTVRELTSSGPFVTIRKWPLVSTWWRVEACGYETALSLVLLPSQSRRRNVQAKAGKTL